MVSYKAEIIRNYILLKDILRIRSFIGDLATAEEMHWLRNLANEVADEIDRPTERELFGRR